MSETALIMIGYVGALLLEDVGRWKTSTERWCRKWNARMDELTATKGEVARLQEADDERI